jgi:hypothetical protein
MKPLQPGVHQALAEWVDRGGTLIYAGADNDPFREVREWWNQVASPYAAPSEHLFERLGIERTPKEGEYRSGKGLVIVERKTPAWFGRSTEGADRLMGLVRRGVEAAGGEMVEANSLQVRRGPYLIAAVMDESTNDETLRLHGRLLDLLDAQLPIREELVLRPGQQAWLLDLDRVTAPAPALLAAAGRVVNWTPAERSVQYKIASPEGIKVVARIRLPSAPTAVTVAGKPSTTHQWHAASRTVLVRHPGSATGIEVQVAW